MRRVIACLLAVCLGLQTPAGMMSANAAAFSNGAVATTSNATTVTETASSSDAWQEGGKGQEPARKLGNPVQAPVEEPGIGEVKVEVRGVLPVSRAAEWNVTLTKIGSDENGSGGNGSVDNGSDEEGVWTETMQLEAFDQAEDTQDYTSGTCEFTDLPKGEYELAIEDAGGSGYQTYRQQFDVKNDRVSILLYNDDPTKYGYEGDKLPGVLRLGDVSGDGVLDEEDLDALLDCLENGETGGDEPYSGCDLNGDGQVDLVDLQYLGMFYKDDRDTKAYVGRAAMILPETVTASASNAVEVGEASIAEVFSGNGQGLKLETKTETGISRETPVVLEAELGQAVNAKAIVIDPIVGSENTITDGMITVSYQEEGGQEKEASFLVAGGQVIERQRAMMRSSLPSAISDAKMGKTIVIDLGKQVAIKRVKIEVTATMNSGSGLVEISKVEFLNNMEDRIPEPQMDIPKELTAKAGSESFTLSWKKAVNVTGYQVEVTGPAKQGSAVTRRTVILDTAQTELLVEQFPDSAKLVNDEEYTVRIQSVNGAWSSGYSDPITVTPEAVAVPDAPENVRVKEGYRSLGISWKDMKNTDSYSLFYREYEDTEGEYTRIDNIELCNYTLEQLKDATKYEIYLTGHNKIGESRPSAHYVGTTTDIDPAVTPNYKLINVPVDGAPTAHILKVENHGGTVDQEFAIVDNDYATAWVRTDWDAGFIYPDKNKSPIVTLDDRYTMDTVILVPDPAQQYNYSGAGLFYTPKGEREQVQVEGAFRRKTSSNGKAYYEFQAAEPFTTDNVQIRLTNSYGGASRISIAEMKFYYYDSIEHDIYDLYGDDMHVTLKENVTQELIDGLRDRLNQKDEVSGEFHPKKELLEQELATAEKLLSDAGLNDVLDVDTQVTKKADSHITFGGGLNTWQPLGVTAMAGDEIVVYVGSPSKKTGDATNLHLIATQYHGESNAWQRDLGTLVAGANQVTIPSITSLDVEQGGQLYIQYVGNASAEQYQVRVSGGNRIPVLRLSGVSDPEEIRALTEAYVRELEAVVPTLQGQHESLHPTAETWNSASKNCILGATDIVTRFAMFSVSSQQILAGLTGETVEEKASQLAASLQAADDMIRLFYQHKGLNDSEDTAKKDQYPVSRLNIRYMRMFAGAFMYAGGLHIGIEWGSIGGLAKAVPVTATEDGRWQDGRYFGWGIAHEIGHIINEGVYAIAEITNNYFSVLAQAHDTNDSVRFHYEDVYDKVTSNVVGRATNVFTQLGLYWQLHLAYDRGGYNYKTFDTYNEQFDNLFFARVDSYVRDNSRAPQPGGIALSLKGADTDNKLMRLSCAAANKNILEFFERWGMTPDETTRAYAEQFTKETRAVWFVNDEARAYVMEHGENGSVAKDTEVTGSLDYAEGSNQVTITLKNTAADAEAMLGYEIYRSELIKNKVERKSVGFVMVSPGSETTAFIDTISTVNNRVFTYEAVGYDKYLNATKATVLPSVKVSHGGVIDKSKWTVTTNMVSAEDVIDPETNPDYVEAKAIEKVLDGDASTTFCGLSANGAPAIVIHLNREETITGLAYTLTGDGNAIGQYTIQVSESGAEDSWITVKKGSFATSQGQLAGGRQVVYFDQDDDSWLYTYDASYVKIVATGQKGKELSISELDLLGQTGDDIRFAEEDSIGVLLEDYHAGQGEGGADVVIPKGSVVFTGTYKGNPAYNTVLLYDENGEIVGGRDQNGSIMAAQMIFAQVPEHGELGEVSEGTWIYYIEPEYLTDAGLPGRVRAELYRVDNAETNNGERLTSNTLFVDVPKELPGVSITGYEAAQGQ